MKKIIYSSFFTLLLFTSCSDYLDVNGKQTNSALVDALSPNQMLAGAINNFTNNQNVPLASYGNKMVYIWGLNSGFTTTDPAYNHIYSSDSYETLFENTYIFADNFQDILDKESLFPEYSYHYGVAKIFKVMSMDYMTALYGDVPYSEALNDAYTAPKYDDDKTIIPKLFKELDEARVFLSNPDAIALGSEDIVFHGDTSKWIEFLNTIELKMLVRLSKTTDATLVALRTSRFAALNVNQNFISADVTVNPGYNLGTLGQRSPLYRAYGLNEALNAFTSARDANAAGDYIGKIVNGTFNDANITTGIVDPRRARMFTTVGGAVVGNVQGVFPLTAISRFSTFYTGRVGVFPQHNINGAGRDAFLLLSAESYFLQAEAIQRGYLTGSAQQAFETGITASFKFYSKTFGALTSTDLPPLNAVTYITNTSAKNGLGWAGSANKINAIMTQKYLALANWNGLELYFDHLRTGFPVLPLPVGVTTSNRPNRLIYPSSEYSTNSNNVPSVTNTEIFSVNSKTPYYLQ